MLKDDLTEEIVRLRREGMLYKDIGKVVGKAKSTVAHHIEKSGGDPLLAARKELALKWKIFHDAGIPIAKIARMTNSPECTVGDTIRGTTKMIRTTVTDWNKVG